MLTLRRAGDRGHANHGWLDTHHTFSFADYQDPRFMGFGPLRVLNDDTVAPGAGFPAHSHRDMEILTYVLDGALRHEDSMGSGSVIHPGDVQRMSAGSGVTHSEYNASRTDPVHFLQIWIVPRVMGLPPGYEQRHFGDDEKRGRLRLVASPDAVDGSVQLQQSVRVFAALLQAGAPVQHVIRKGWLHVARGAADVNGRQLATGDGLGIEGEETLTLRSAAGAEVLLFDLDA